jgi:hypothetical protein
MERQADMAGDAVVAAVVWAHAERNGRQIVGGVRVGRSEGGD